VVRIEVFSFDQAPERFSFVVQRAHPLINLDRPEILSFIFHPRRTERMDESDPHRLFFRVAPSVRIGCRFHPAGKDDFFLLLFHGNGEIADDYDDLAPHFTSRGINLLVTDYRGYGVSDGTPSVASMLRDASVVFHDVVAWMYAQGYNGALHVLGRSLGSVRATEVGIRHQDHLGGVIIESGSAINVRHYFYSIGLLPFNHEIWREGTGFFNIEKIRRITRPTLNIHAEGDSLIPVQEALIMHENSGARDKGLVLIPHADHNNLMVVGETRYFTAIADFIERHQLRS